jgi:hypothetical protein
MGPIVAGVLIALIGGIFTLSYRNREMAVMEVSAFQAYIAHLRNEDERKIALVMIEHFGEEELAMKIVKTGAKGTENFGDEKMRTTVPADQKILPKETIVTVPEDSALVTEPHTKVTTAKGWVYLGDYSSQQGEWRRKYFDFGPKAEPYALKNQSLVVTTDAINVRISMPGESAKFGRVIDVLKAKSAVKVLDVRSWLSTGYIWASVAYVKPKPQPSHSTAAGK